MPTVSVVIPSFNRGYCIKACIESVLSQSFSDFEIVVVDDGSHDDTKEQVLSFDDPRIRYVAHDVNRGGAAARNTGIRSSSAEFVAFLDSDDRWLPSKLEKQLQLLRRRGEDYGLVYTRVIARDAHGNEVWRSDHRAIDGNALSALLIANAVGTFSSILVRRSLLERVHGLDEAMKSCQDWDLLIRLSKVGKFCCVEDHLVLYTQNRGDRDRISANPESIIHGHRRLFMKIQPDLRQLSTSERVKSLKNFMNAFVMAGALTDTIRMGLQIVRHDGRLENVRAVMFGLLRIAKRKLTRNLGY